MSTPSLLLPPLKKNHKVPNLSRAGEWVVQSKAVLESISDGLATEVDANYFNVDSIPDVWARPLLFQMALFEKGHPQHGKVLGEWRGLAALIALMKWRQFPFTAQELTINEEGPEFGRIAAKLAPSSSLYSDTTWKNLYCLLLEGTALGITSPTTLFCTATSYNAYSIPWYDGQYLRDPLHFPRGGGKEECLLPPHEREAVAEWLRRLQQKLARHKGQGINAERDEKIWEHLLGLMQAYLNELGGGNDTLKIDKDVLNMSGGGFFQYLDEVPARPQEETSYVTLIPSRNNAPKTKILVLDREIAKQWQVSERDIRVWGIETLDTAIPFAGLKGQRNKLNNQPLNDAEWRMPSDFFTEKLYLLESAKAFTNMFYPKGAQELGKSPLLPLQAELLEYFDPRDLANRLEFGKRDDEYTVRLRLTLKGDQDGHEDFYIEKGYSKEQVEKLPNIPVLEIWPNFKSEGWNTYYTLYDGAGTFYAKPYPAAVSKQQKLDRHDKIDHEISRCEEYPEAMLCFYENSKAGLLLVEPPPIVDAKGGVEEWHVGVDFGTTNTTVYVRKRRGHVEILSFKDRLFPLTLPDASVRSETAAFKFIPAFEQPMPFHSLFQTLASNIQQDLNPLLDGHIFYINQDTYRPENQDGRIGSPKNLHRDLKWSVEQRDKILIKLFLEQLYLQIRAEAAADGIHNIRWSYSTPSSFTEGQMRAVEGIWEVVTGQSSNQVRKQTESLSTAAFFLKTMNAPTARGTICIDIGGFSSDLAIWQKNKMQLQSSLRFASRHIFVETIHTQFEQFRDFFDIKGQLSINDIEIFLLSKAGKQLMKNLTTGGDRPEVRLLRQYIALGVSGILYYAGLLIRYLIESDEYSEELPYVYIGGNGAKMLYWLDHGRYDESSPTNTLFKKVLVDASGLSSESFKLVVTPIDKMKHEVAAGLVHEHALERIADPVVLAGEAFQGETGDSYEWDTILTPDLLRKGLEHRNSAHHLKALLRLVNGFAEEKGSVLDPILYEQKNIHDALEGVAQYLAEMEGRQKDHIDVEPLFIVLLKKFIELRRRN